MSRINSIEALSSACELCLLGMELRLNLRLKCSENAELHEEDADDVSDE